MTVSACPLTCSWPDNLYRTYMNGRLKKVDMESRLLSIKKGIDNKVWYPEWDDKERWAAQRLSLIHI